MLVSLLTLMLFGAVTAIDSCLTEVQPVFGGEDSLGQPFSDLAFLYKNEDNAQEEALNSVQLCTNQTGTLVGMRGQVVTINKESNELVDQYYMNKIGNVPNDLSGCQTF